MIGFETGAGQIDGFSSQRRIERINTWISFRVSVTPLTTENIVEIQDISLLTCATVAMETNIPLRRSRSITSLLRLRRQQFNGPTVLSLMLSAHHVRWLMVEERIARHKEEVSQCNSGGGSVLFQALSRRTEDYPPFSVVRSLLQAYPAAIWEFHYDGKTSLLEIACWKLASLETLELLIKARPSVKQDSEAIHALWMSYCRQYGGEHAFLEVLNSDSQEAWLIGSKFHLVLQYITAEKLLPCTLHTAAATPSCSVDLFRFLCEQLPNQIRQKDEFGRLPLHYALDTAEDDSTGVQQAKARLLFAAMPNDQERTTSSSAGNSEILTTIGWQEDAQVHPSDLARLLDQLEVLDVLWTEFHDTFRMPVDPSWNLISGAVTVPFCPTDFLQFLMTRHPEKLREEDCFGWLPLHHALGVYCEERKGPEELHIEMLLLAYPDAITKKDKKGRLPFHLAIINGRGLSVLKLLHRHYPESIYQKDDETGFVPFLLAAHSPLASLTDVYYLLTCTPQVLQQVI